MLRGKIKIYVKIPNIISSHDFEKAKYDSRNITKRWSPEFRMQLPEKMEESKLNTHISEYIVTRKQFYCYLITN